jgi:hypothetical protein
MAQAPRERQPFARISAVFIRVFRLNRVIRRKQRKGGLTGKIETIINRASPQPDQLARSQRGPFRPDRSLR